MICQQAQTHSESVTYRHAFGARLRLGYTRLGSRIGVVARLPLLWHPGQARIRCVDTERSCPLNYQKRATESPSGAIRHRRADPAHPQEAGVQWRTVVTLQKQDRSDKPAEDTQTQPFNLEGWRRTDGY